MSASKLRPGDACSARSIKPGARQATAGIEGIPKSTGRRDMKSQ